MKPLPSLSYRIKRFLWNVAACALFALAVLVAGGVFVASCTVSDSKG